MKTRFRGIVPVLLASAALPGAAWASVPRPPVPITPVTGAKDATAPPVGPAQSTSVDMLAVCGAAVSPASCSSGTYLLCASFCQQAATTPGATPCAVSHTAAECAPILQPQFQASYAAARAQLAAGGQPTTKSVVLPPKMARQHGTQLGAVFDAMPVASNALTPLVNGTGASYQDSNWTWDFVGSVDYPRYSQADEGPARTLTMSSCDEYAWKKWGTVSWFNDVAHKAGTNYGWVVDVVGAGTLGVVTNALSIGQRWDGQPIALNGTSVAWPTTIPRNAFFSVMPSWLAASTDPSEQAVYKAMSALAAQPAITFPATTTLNEAWAANEKRYLEEAGVTASTFADNERRMAAYTSLVSQLTQDQAALDTLLNVRITVIPPAYRAKYAAQVAAAQAVVTQDQQAITAALVAEWTYDARSGCLGYTFPVPGESFISQDYATSATATTFTLRANACDWSPHQFYRAYVDMFEPQVEAARAQCIADTGDDFTALETPSSVFKDPSMYAPYNHALTRGRNDQTTQSANAALQAADAYANSTSMEQYFWNYEHRDAINEAFKTKEVAQAKVFEDQTTTLPLQGAAPGTPGQVTYIGQQTQDQNEVGGSWFGGGYSYMAKWSVTPRVEDPNDPVTTPARFTQDPVPHICALSADAGASLKVWATVLTQPITILDAALEVTAAPPALGSTSNTQQAGTATLKQAHLTILNNVFNNGQDYLAKPLKDVGLKEGASWSGSTFDYPITSTPVDQGFSVIIPILAIPVEVGAGITVKLGTDFKGSAQPPVYCDRANVGFSMQTSVAPSAEVDGKVWVAVDLGIASAGVEGDLTIFKGSMPVTGSIQLSSAATDDPNQISLVVNSTGSLQMTELSGDVDLYAEVLGARADVSLFSWSGFNQTVPLYSLTQSYPLIAINYKLNPSLTNVETQK